MEAVVKIDLTERLKSGGPIILDLGCGTTRREGRIGIDKLDLPSVDIVADVEEGLSFLPKDSVDEIHSNRRRNRVKRLFGFLVNLHRSLQEFYEENLCYIFPCYALKIVFTPEK